MDLNAIEEAVGKILEAIGEDPNREGLVGTPKRVAQMFEEMFGGLEEDPKKVLTIVPIHHDELVLVKDIPIYSTCEHHLLPFYGRAHVAYIPNKERVTGISKLARVVDIIARRPQTQERLTKEIADTICEALNPQGVMVVIEAEHLCMVIRGIKKPGSATVTSAVRGLFRREASSREEVLSLIKE